MGKYVFDGKVLDRAIAGVKALKLAELKAKREITWRLDSRGKSYVVAEARQIGRALAIAIDLDIMDQDGYSDKKNIGLSQYGGATGRAKSEQQAFEDVQRSALQRLNILKTRGIV